MSELPAFSMHIAIFRMILLILLSKQTFFNGGYLFSQDIFYDLKLDRICDDISKRYQFDRPNPIVQMGLFMDGDGIPLAFCIHPENQNEQTTLKPIKKRILKDFKLSKLIVCSDAGLALEKIDSLIPLRIEDLL